MAAAERNLVMNLIDTLSDSDDERDRLRRLLLHDLHPESVLAEVARHSPVVGRRIYDRSAEVMLADGVLRSRERRFLAAMRSRSQVPRWHHWRTVWWGSWRIRARVVVGALLVIALAVVGSRIAEMGPDAAPPQATLHPAVQLVVAPPMPTAAAPEVIFELVRRSIVTVTVRHDHRPVSEGSGVAIGGDGGTTAFVVTNRHVIDTPVRRGSRFRVEVRTSEEARFDAVLDFSSAEHDLALLAVPAAASWLPPLALEPRARLRVGQTVYALGSPIGLRQTFTSGIVSALRGPWIQTDATVHSGSSGGPLLTTSGTLCGIMTRSHTSKNFSFALPADAVVSMLIERDQIGQASPAGIPDDAHG
jgi:S1-C subfamily serine protease